MPRVVYNQLSVVKIRAMKGPGRHVDGKTNEGSVVPPCGSEFALNPVDFQYWLEFSIQELAICLRFILMLHQKIVE